MLGRVGLAAGAVIWAGTAQAMVCSFASECFEADGCMESSFGLEVSADAEGALRFETEFGDLDVVWSFEDIQAFAALAQGAGARYLLSTTQDGARLTVHLDGPTAVTYIGQCEGGL